MRSRARRCSPAGWGSANPSAVASLRLRIALGGVRVSVHSAGHVRGAAQIRLEGRHGVWVVSGDYKRAPDPTCDPFEVVPCDTFVTESTFALPIFRWDSTDTVIAEVMTWWDENRHRGVAPPPFCYNQARPRAC